MNQGQAERTGLARTLVAGLAAAPWAPMALLIVQAAYLWSGCLLFPYQLGYGEGQVLHSALDLIRGRSIYPPIGDYPYVSSAYPPLYILLCGVGAWLAGPGFLIGRLISWVSGIAVCVLAAVIVWRETGVKAAAALAAALIPGVVFAAWWMALMRVDMLALALSMLGLVLAMRGRYTIAAVVFALALYTRQGAIAAPAAVVAALVLERRWRAAARFALVLAAALVVPFLALMAATGGWFYTHVFKFLALQEWTWSTLLVWAGRILASWPALVALGAGAACWALLRRRAVIVALFFVISGLVSLTAGKAGSDANYFLELFVAACVLTAMIYGVNLRAASQGARRQVACAALTLVITAQLVWMVLGSRAVAQQLMEPADARVSRLVVERVRETRGDVLCGDYGLLHLAGRDVVLQPFEFTQMVRAGLVEPGPVLDDVRRGRFGLIVMRFDPGALGPVAPGHDVFGGRWYGPLVNAIGEHYVLVLDVRPYYLLVPKRPS